jgi:CubicO group peptidase (beta-lactamase class C family)
MKKIIYPALMTGILFITPALAQQSVPTILIPKSDGPSGPVIPAIKAAPGTVFNVSRFSTAMSARLGPLVTGYSWTIMQDGKLVASDGNGYARTVKDGARFHGPEVRQNIASVSKTVTTVAVLQLLRLIGKNEDTKILNYLPSGWVAGPNVASLSFADLLNHRSGFPNANNNSDALLNFAAMRTMVAKGTSAAPPAPGRRPFDYRNVNFALLRVLLRKMYDQTGQSSEPFARTMQDQLGKLGPPSNGAVYQPAINNYFYAAWVQKKIFEPIGSKGTLCQDKSPTQTLYYDNGQTIAGEKSMGNNSWTNFCGSGGWYLSSNDLGRLMAALRHTEILLPKEWSDKMVTKRFGLYRNAGTHGDDYSHAGVVGSGNQGGIYACAIRFSINVEAALVVNTKTPDPFGSDPCAVVRSAFDDAWQ